MSGTEVGNTETRSNDGHHHHSYSTTNNGGDCVTRGMSSGGGGINIGGGSSVCGTGSEQHLNTNTGRNNQHGQHNQNNSLRGHIVRLNSIEPNTVMFNTKVKVRKHLYTCTIYILLTGLYLF